MEVRENALKLRYFPNKHPTDESGQVLDLNWSWIASLRGPKIGELRIDDSIGGNDNLRIIFYQGDQAVRSPLPMIWILDVMQKKRDYFTVNELRIFKARRILVIERFYRHRTN